MASTQERELKLIGNVQLRIASSKDDKSLKTNLDKYLAPLLLKLASDHLAVRNEVIKVCKFIDTLLAPTTFELPLTDLLTQFRDVSKDLVRLFDLRYIKIGLDRISESRRREYFPQVIQGLQSVHSVSPKQASGLFSLFIRLLLHVPLPARASQEDLKLRDKLELSDSDTQYLSERLGKLLLYQGPVAGSQPSLTKDDLEFFGFGDETFWKSASHPAGSVNLAETKIVATKFLASGVFTDSERLIPAIVAASDTNSRISETGNDMLKRCLTVSDLESDLVVDSLLALYLGDGSGRGPARPPLKIKILNVLSKSAQAAKHSYAERIVKDALDPETSGLEGSKLRTAAFAFVNWITRMSEGAIDTAPLLEETKLLIEGQGWPEVAKTATAQSDAAVLESRSKAYETLGLLIRSKAKSADPLAPGITPVHLTHFLFRSLLEDTSGNEMSLSIEQAISNTLVAISTRPLDDNEENNLLGILESFIKSDGPNDGASRTTYPALRFVNQCFRFSNVRARYLNVLALTVPGIRRELEEEAKNGLDPFVHSKTFRHSSASQAIELPEFGRLSQAFFSEHDDRLPGHNEALVQAILFCKSVLFHVALANGASAPVIDDRWLMNIDSMLTNDETSVDGVKQFFQSIPSSQGQIQQALEKLLSAAFAHTVGPSSSATVSQALLDLVRFANTDALNLLQSRASELKRVLASTDVSVRRNAARTFGILASQNSLSTGNVAEAVRDLWAIAEKRSGVVGAEVYRVQGALLALGSWLSRLSYRSKGADNANLGYGIVSSKSTSEISTQLSKLSTVCIDILKRKENKDLQEAAVYIMVEYIRFDVPPEMTNFAMDKSNEDIMKSLVSIAKNGHANAVTLLGLLSFVCEPSIGEGSQVTQLIDYLYSLHEERKPELQFEVGQALSLTAFGRDSKTLTGWVDVPGPNLTSSPRDQITQVTFDKALSAIKNTKPSLRQAGAIWLLSLLQYGGHTQFMKGNLSICQRAFKALLGDKDSLNQETAASGLTLVYERGDQEHKDSIVKDLVGAFISNEPTNLAGQVSEDTVLFDEGALPTGEGQSVTTYKDIMKLAREVGDDGLVYRFMNLAKNSSVWTSRAAFGRFGLSRVLSDASMDGYLAQNPKLYRALFRYRFDPNENVRSAMNDIWTALVKDPPKIINEYFDDILQDLLKHMVDGKEWRARQASCAALANLVQGRPLEKYEKFLSDIWAQAFKLTDDQKGSVRVEADKLVRTLTTIVKRTLEAGEGSAKNATAMLKEVLPFLLGNNGMNSAVKEQQIYALKTITDLVKVGSAVALRNFLPDIICGLLEQLSALEPGEVNYLRLNADKYKMSEEEIDDARASATNKSPMMEAVERCLDHLDESSMQALHPRLIDTIKTSIGLPSRVGVSRVLVSLSTRRNFLFRQYSGEYLVLLRNRFLTDRNDMISTSAATASGYLARIAPDKNILKTIEWAQKQFFVEEDERRRIVAGEMMLAIGKFATDRFNDLSSSILPFIFLAKHDTFESSAELFKSTWDDNVSGPRVVLLHLKEILALCESHLESPRWPIKHASAFAIAETVTAAGKDMDEATAHLLWPYIEKAIGGKTWEGKEKVLSAFVLLATSSSALQKDKAISDQMRKIMFREAKRNNAVYQEHSIAALGDFIIAYPDADWFEKTLTVVEPLLDQLLEALNEKMDVDSKKTDAASSRVTALRTAANAMKTLLTAVDPAHRKGGELKSDLEQVLALVKKAMSEKDRSINEAIFEGLKSLFEKLHAADGALHDAVLLEYGDLLFGHDDHREPTRTKAAEAAIPLAKIAKGRPGLQASLKQKVEDAMALERSPSVKQVWAKVIEEL